MRRAINLAVIMNRKVLLVTEGDGWWTLPGGKPEEGESEIDCLERELTEEIPDASFSIGNYYDSFRGRTPRTGDVLESIVYWGNHKEGELRGGSEIREVEYFSYPPEVGVSNITRKALDGLHKDGYI